MHNTTGPQHNASKRLGGLVGNRISVGSHDLLYPEVEDPVIRQRFDPPPIKKNNQICTHINHFEYTN